MAPADQVHPQPGSASLPEQRSTSAAIAKWSFCGALLGVLILHPLIMLLGNLMQQNTLQWALFFRTARLEFLRSFTPEMLPWTLGFAAAAAFAGALYGRMRELTRELARREELFRMITTSARDGILLIDEHGEIRFSNPAANSHTGYDPSALLHRRAEEVILSPDTAESGAKPATSGLSLPGQSPFETSLVQSDGSHTPVEVTVGNGAQREGNNEVIVVRDISERKRLERLRRDTERIVRHDLKAPLNTIIGYSRILLREDTGMDPRKPAEAIQQQGERMLHMIDHSLDLFRIEEGSYELSPEWFDLEPVLHRLAREHGALKRTRNLSVGVEVACEREGDWGCPIRGERHHIESMISNLLQNALEGSPEGGVVAVRAESAPNRIRVAVHNSGEVPHQIRDRFFEPHATWGKPDGTGLGTYSARLLARAHRGDIGFSSSPGDGTRVWVDLPRDPDQTD
ncbi:MAG: ATP-binding protein [Desulfohalobiaceae bacterium]